MEGWTLHLAWSSSKQGFPSWDWEPARLDGLVSKRRQGARMQDEDRTGQLFTLTGPREAREAREYLGQLRHQGRYMLRPLLHQERLIGRATYNWTTYCLPGTSTIHLRNKKGPSPRAPLPVFLRKPPSLCLALPFPFQHSAFPPKSVLSQLALVFSVVAGVSIVFPSPLPLPPPESLLPSRTHVGSIYLCILCAPPRRPPTYFLKSNKRYLLGHVFVWGQEVHTSHSTTHLPLQSRAACRVNCTRPHIWPDPLSQATYSTYISVAEHTTVISFISNPSRAAAAESRLLHTAANRRTVVPSPCTPRSPSACWLPRSLCRLRNPMSPS